MFGTKVCKEGHAMDPSWDVCPVCIAPVRGWFVEMSVKGAMRIFRIHEGKSRIGIGAECEIRPESGLHRQHALLIARDGEFHISTLGSGGTLLVNNSETANSILIDGDLILLNGKEFKFKCL